MTIYTMCVCVMHHNSSGNIVCVCLCVYKFAMKESFFGFFYIHYISQFGDNNRIKISSKSQKERKQERPSDTMQWLNAMNDERNLNEKNQN